LRDEALHLPEVFRLTIKQAIVNGWRALAPMLDGFALATRAAAPRLAPEVRPVFLQALSEVLVMAEKSVGSSLDRQVDQVFPELAERIATLRATAAGQPAGYAWGWLDAPTLHPSMLAQQRYWRAPS